MTPHPDQITTLKRLLAEADDIGGHATLVKAALAALPSLLAAVRENEKLREALGGAWLAGFMSSGEGYNGEYPFEGMDPDADLLARRDGYLAALNQPLEGGSSAQDRHPAIREMEAEREALLEAGHVFLRAVNFREAEPDRLTVAEYVFRAALNGASPSGGMSEFDNLRDQVARLARCLLPAQMALAEREMIGDPVPDETVVYSFMGSGASDLVTAGDIRLALSTNGGKG